MARRRFNRNQPRDRNGRWTSGGGSSSAKRSKTVSKSAAASARRKTIQRRRNVAVAGIAAVGLAANGRIAVKHGAMAGAMASRGRYVMATAHGVSAATSAYRGLSFAADLGVRNSKRFTAKQKATFTRRKEAVDKQVRRVERVSNAVLAGGYILSVAGPVAASYARSRRGNTGVGPKISGFLAGKEVPNVSRSGGARAKKVGASFGGVYNLSDFKGKRV